jgi:hypothetical protein
MAAAPFVTVGVPVWHGGRFLEESLRSIQNQSHQNLTILISIDGSDPESERVCRPFLQDSRFQLVIQPQRLGWVGNTNYLISRVETPWWIWHPQDDVLDPRCIEVLLHHAGENPVAAAIFCDIACFGLRDDALIQSSVTGDVVQRQLALIREHLPAVAFRGLTRLEALRFCGQMPTSAVDSFGLDAVWMAALARWGELIRVPAALYRKRFHTQSEHARWAEWTFEQRWQVWIAHCADMLAQAVLVPATAVDRHTLWLATLDRLTAPGWLNSFLRGDSAAAPVDSSSLLRLFIEYLRRVRGMDVPAWLEDPWVGLEHAATDRLESHSSLVELRTAVAAHDRRMAAMRSALDERDKALIALRTGIAQRDHEFSGATHGRAWKLASLLRRLYRLFRPQPR